MKFKIIRGTYLDYIKEWKKELLDNLNEIKSLGKRLDLQVSTDGYKDDLINTLQILLITKDEVIGSLTEKVRELKGD